MNDDDRLFPLLYQLTGIKDGSYKLPEPYYFDTNDSLPGFDFNRQIYKPREDEKFPEGVLGIYVDDDFWCIATLPYRFTELTLEQIINELWPEYKDKIRVTPDHGSIEREIYNYKTMYESEKSKSEYLEKALRISSRQNKRLRAIRPAPNEHNETKYLAQNLYFIRQYEALLVGVAHPAKPMQEWKGLCEHCGLYVSDRVHSRKYIDMRKNKVHINDHFAITGEVKFREEEEDDGHKRSKSYWEERKTILEL